MPKPKTLDLANIELDTSFDPFQATAKAPSRPRSDVPMEKFQVHIPAAAATEIRVEAAKRGMSYSALVLQAWELWKQENN